LRAAAKIGLGELIFVFFFVDLFDNVGTLIGVCEGGGFLRDGKLPRASRALVADAIGTMFGALTGTSTVTSYYRGAVSLGYVLRTIGRGDSGLCHGSCAGARGSSDVRRRRARPMGRFQRSLPCLPDACGPPVDVQHCHRSQPGVLSFTFVKLGSGKYREVSALVWILAILFVLRYAFPGSQ